MVYFGGKLGALGKPLQLDVGMERGITVTLHYTTKVPQLSVSYNHNIGKPTFMGPKPKQLYVHSNFEFQCHSFKWQLYTVFCFKKYKNKFIIK